MEFEIAVPTHRRAELCAKMISDLPPETHHRVTLFLSDEKDEQQYEALPFKKANTGARNLLQKLNYIHYHYPIGTKVVQLEDDIKLVEADPNNPQKTQQITNIEDLIIQAFKKQPQGLWCFGSTANAFYMLEEDKRGLYFAAGFAFGFTSTHDKELELTVPYKNDYERTIKYFLKYGSILRLGNTGVATKSFVTKGGLQENTSTEARRAEEEKCVEYLLERYGYMLRINKNRRSPMPEIAFRNPRIHPDECRLRERRRNATRQ
jgi:hypothetical protein